MNKFIQLKRELKELAKTISHMRVTYKQHQRENNGDGGWNNDPEPKSREYRHKHIAYSLLRGRTMDQIERKTREDNKPDMELVNSILKEYSDENVCDNESGPKQVSTGCASGSCSCGIPAENA